MFYRFLLFILLLCVATFYIVIGGLTHYTDKENGSNSWGGPTPGQSTWERHTNESAVWHPTVTAFASANVTVYWRTNGSGSGESGSGPIQYDEYACGTAWVSAETLTITIGDGEPETHEPSGMVEHKAFVYMTYVPRSGGSLETAHIEGWNNVDRTDYEGPYYETTAAYNSYGFFHTDMYLSAEGDCYISNKKELLLAKPDDVFDHTDASAYARAP